MKLKMTKINSWLRSKKTQANEIMKQSRTWNMNSKEWNVEENRNANEDGNEKFNHPFKNVKPYQQYGVGENRVLKSEENIEEMDHKIK